MFYIYQSITMSVFLARRWVSLSQRQHVLSISLPKHPATHERCQCFDATQKPGAHQKPLACGRRSRDWLQSRVYASSKHHSVQQHHAERHTHSMHLHDGQDDVSVALCGSNAQRTAPPLCLFACLSRPAWLWTGERTVAGYVRHANDARDDACSQS